VNHASTAAEFRGCAARDVDRLPSSSSMRAERSHTSRHAWLGPRSTHAHRLLISGSTAFLHADTVFRLAYKQGLHNNQTPHSRV
jgi:hypothetical protein